MKKNKKKGEGKKEVKEEKSLERIISVKSLANEENNEKKKDKSKQKENKPKEQKSKNPEKKKESKEELPPKKETGFIPEEPEFLEKSNPFSRMVSPVIAGQTQTLPVTINLERQLQDVSTGGSANSTKDFYSTREESKSSNDAYTSNNDRNTSYDASIDTSGYSVKDAQPQSASISTNVKTYDVNEQISEPRAGEVRMKSFRNNLDMPGIEKKNDGFYESKVYRETT
jgi:hypothetical protein